MHLLLQQCQQNRILRSTKTEKSHALGINMQITMLYLKSDQLKLKKKMKIRKLQETA